MDLIDELKQEHIEALLRLDGLESALATLHGSGEAPVEAVERLARIWNWFQVDINVHFRKEEEALFPAAVGAMPSEEGPIAQMRAEHREFEELREQVVGALETVRHGCCGRKEASARLVRAGDQLCALLREHIWKEDNVLFPVLRTVLDSGRMAAAAKAAARIGRPLAAVGN